MVESPDFKPIVPSFKLATNGLSYERASLYGMPHLHCDPHGIDGRCVICGRKATEKHHMSAKGASGGARYLTVQTPDGPLRMESALVALCHECHDKFRPQGYEYSVNWYWKDQESADLWWSGTLYAMGIKPHSDELFEYGFYIFRANGNVIGGVFG